VRRLLGDPTDAAPLVLFTKLGGKYRESQAAYEKVRLGDTALAWFLCASPQCTPPLPSPFPLPQIRVIPFESLHKWQASLVRDAAVPGGRVLHLKGAPERLFLCGSAVKGEDALAETRAIQQHVVVGEGGRAQREGPARHRCRALGAPADFDQSLLSVAWVTSQPAPFPHARRPHRYP